MFAPSGGGVEVNRDVVRDTDVSDRATAPSVRAEPRP